MTGKTSIPTTRRDLLRGSAALPGAFLAPVPARSDVPAIATDAASESVLTAADLGKALHPK